MPIRVMHYYTYPENSGGPITYIKNIMESKYFPDVTFDVCYQGKAASQLRGLDIKRIIEEIECFSPDILHVHGVQSEGLIGVYAGKKAKVPKILMTVHGIQIDTQNMNPLKKMLFQYVVEPYALHNSDAVYCVCDAMSQNPFIKKHSKNTLPTIQNFITDSFMDAYADDENLVSNDKIIVATVGRVSFDKGMQELEQCIIKDEKPNVQYWIIGSGDYEETMKKNLSKYVETKKVVFWGQQKDIKPFLHRIDVFLFLSHHENLSIALLEAASQKCCCIATDVGGNSEVIQNGVDGILVPVFDTEAAINALKLVIEDVKYRKQLGETSANKIKFEFGEKIFSEKLYSVYLNLYNHSKGVAANDTAQ